MSKRRNRELMEREAVERMMRDPDYVAGAMASGVAAEINPALRPFKRRESDQEGL